MMSPPGRSWTTVAKAIPISRSVLAFRTWSCPEAARHYLQLLQLGLGEFWAAWIDEQGHSDCCRDKRVQQLKPLRSYLRSQVGHAREIAARPGKAGDKSNRDWVAPHQEHDRYCRGRRLGRERGRSVGRGNHCHMMVNQIGRQCGQSTSLAA
jgi:hypothetical protein